MSISLTYAGIGSRKIHHDKAIVVANIARRLAEMGYTLRSGAAGGSDAAFEAGCDMAHGRKEIFIPWPEFNGSASELCLPSKEAMKMAESIHPRWSVCSQGARKLHARNCHQILGASLDDPVAFVLCWTPDGCESMETRTSRTGGTGQAIHLASMHGIPVFNLKNPDAEERLSAFVNKTMIESISPGRKSLMR